MSKDKEENLNEEIKTELPDNREEVLEETEAYQKATFKEKLSLKFRKRLIINKMHTLYLIVLLLLVFCFLNYWAQKQELAQIDVTSEKLYSLTDASKEQLKNINKDVNIYAYGFTTAYENYITLMKQYAAFSEHINFDVIDESTNYEAVTKYALSDYGTAMLVECGEKSKVVSIYDFLDYDSNYNQVDVTEQCITNAILNVSTDDPVNIYVLIGNGEYTTSSLSYLTSYLKAQVYECNELNILTISEIPDDCDILAIVNPTVDFSEEQANMIINYINKGGNIFFNMLKENKDSDFSNLQRILDLYGVTVEYGLLCEGDSSHCYTSGNIRYPNILVLNSSSSSKITEDIYRSGLSVVAPNAQPLVISEVNEENVNVTNSELLSTSNKCYNTTDLSKNVSMDEIAKNYEPNKYVVGAELTRTVTTSNENGEESKIESKMIAYSCPGMFLDKEPSTSYSAISNPYIANPDIALNTFATLAEQEDLITVTKVANATSYEITASQDRMVQLIIFVIPVIIIIVGIIVWQVRKRKR